MFFFQKLHDGHLHFGTQPEISLVIEHNSRLYKRVFHEDVTYQHPFFVKIQIDSIILQIT